jgi:hypothetical protein
MQFHEKLDFLMNMTKTSNSALGQKVKLDASHISRLRRGQRGAIKDKATLAAMADYFARSCTSEYQRKALADMLNLSQPALEGDQLAESILKWLAHETKEETDAVGVFLDGFMNLNQSKERRAAPKIKAPPLSLPPEEISIYYGIDGKRQAARFFLSEVMAQSRPRTLLLYSDEATDWMTADREFAAQWAQLMKGVLAKGNRIKIIHTVSRDLDEMLKAIGQWMPLYMTGAIEPYYYPKIRDGVYKRTLFVAPGLSAVVSSSVGQMADQAANLLFRNQDAADAFAEEFNQYLLQCKPLMKVFTFKDDARYFDTLLDFEKEACDAMIKTESLSLLTMPEALSTRTMSRIGMAERPLIDYQRQRTNILANHLQTHRFTEIIPIFPLEKIKNNMVKVSLSDMMNGGSLYYTREEYLEHLEHLVYLAQTYERFHIHLIEGLPESNYTVYAKEDLGAIIAKTSAPPVVLAVSETNMSAAFWDFLREMIGEKDYLNPNQHEETKKLLKYIQKIKQ